jgi:hypothetical protein
MQTFDTMVERMRNKSEIGSRPSTHSQKKSCSPLETKTDESSNEKLETVPEKKEC